MEIRPERLDDHEAVLDVHRQAFGDHGQVVAGLAEALRPDALSLVAEDAGPGGRECDGDPQPAGRTRDGSYPCRSSAPWLSSRTSSGAASARRSSAAAYELLDERREPLLFLEGDPGYYSRLGFTAGGDHGFRKPSLRIPDAAFQVKTLSAYEPWMTGTFVYAQAFWDHDCVGLRD